MFYNNLFILNNNPNPPDPEKIAGQVLTGISGTALSAVAIGAAILNPLSLAAITASSPAVGSFLSGLGIWAAVATNPALLAAFASIIAILCLALVIGIILLSHVAMVQKPPGNRNEPNPPFQQIRLANDHPNNGPNNAPNFDGNNNANINPDANPILPALQQNNPLRLANDHPNNALNFVLSFRNDFINSRRIFNAPNFNGNNNANNNPNANPILPAPQLNNPLRLANDHPNNAPNNVVNSNLHFYNDASYHDFPNVNEQFFQACQGGNFQNVQFYLECGGQLNYVDNQGNTPLIIASREERLDIVEFLLNNHADPLIRNQRNQSALDILKESNRNNFNGERAQIINLLENVEIEQLAKAPNGFNNLNHFNGFNKQSLDGFYETVKTIPDSPYTGPVTLLKDYVKEAYDNYLRVNYKLTLVVGQYFAGNKKPIYNDGRETCIDELQTNLFIFLNNIQGSHQYSSDPIQYKMLQHICYYFQTKKQEIQQERNYQNKALLQEQFYKDLVKYLFQKIAVSQSGHCIDRKIEDLCEVYEKISGVTQLISTEDLIKNAFFQFRQTVLQRAIEQLPNNILLLYKAKNGPLLCAYDSIHYTDIFSNSETFTHAILEYQEPNVYTDPHQTSTQAYYRSRLSKAFYLGSNDLAKWQVHREYAWGVLDDMIKDYMYTNCTPNAFIDYLVKDKIKELKKPTNGSGILDYFKAQGYQNRDLYDVNDDDQEIYTFKKDPFLNMLRQMNIVKNDLDIVFHLMPQ